MKAKLFKVRDGFFLQELPRKGIGAAVCEHTLGSTWGDGDYKLSIKNCQAIECGYDLNGIKVSSMEDFYAELGEGPTGNDDINSMIKKNYAYGVEFALHKILEILVDKKFNEDDMRKAVYEGVKIGRGTPFVVPATDDYLKSLQKSEWDVEIIMEEKWIPGTSVYGQGDYELIAKLDSEGNIILSSI